MRSNSYQNMAMKIVNFKSTGFLVIGIIPVEIEVDFPNSIEKVEYENDAKDKDTESDGDSIKDLM